MIPTPSEPIPERGPWRYWRAAIVVGILLRLAAVAATDVFPTVANTWDSNFYHETAAAIASGQGYSFQGAPTAFFPPGYPAFVGLAYAIGGSASRSGQAANLAASLGLLLAAGWLARETLGVNAGRRTMAVLALEPSQIIMPAFLMTETFCGATLAVALAALARRVSGRGAAWLLLAAVAGTLAGMTRGTGFLVVPAAVIALQGWRSWGPRRALAALVVVGLVATAVIGPWMMRNERRLGRAVPISNNVGINLLVGNNPNAFGARADPPGGIPQTGDEIRDEEIAKERAWDYARAHPGRVLASLPMKAGRLLAFAPAVTYRAELGAKWGRAVALPILVFAEALHLAFWVAALWFGLRHCRGPVTDRRALFRLMVFVIGAWTLGHLPFMGGARFFFPVQFLLVTAAVAPRENPPSA